MIYFRFFTVFTFILTILFASTLSARSLSSAPERDLVLDAYVSQHLVTSQPVQGEKTQAILRHHIVPNPMPVSAPTFRQFIKKAENSTDPSLQKLNYHAEQYRQKHMGAIKKQLAKEFAYVQVMGLIAVGALYALPEEASGFDKKTIRNTSIKNAYLKNVRAGPVIDTDGFFVNYITHPYWGGAYYTWGRSRGLSDHQSIALSAFMSTFFWEYGWEALAETPSYQDLIVTPLLGALVGRAGYKALTKIQQNEGKLWGSKKLGSVAKVVINPLGTVNDRINHFLRKISSSSQVETSLSTGLTYTSSSSINLTAHDASKSSWRPKLSLLQLNVAFD